MAPNWEILIATIPHRHGKLCALLAGLDVQMRPGMGALVFRDNLEHAVSAKRQALLEAATAEYVCFADDDDHLYPEYAAQVMTALAERPDYVGFIVACFSGGEFQYRAEHSLRYGGWHQWPEKTVRDISHLNPVRRELALLARFDGAYGEDRSWADRLRGSGRLRTEAWIPQVLYGYRFDPADESRTWRARFPEPLPALPGYPWLRVLDPAEILEGCR